MQTEYGNNIVMVIKRSHENPILEVCSKGLKQLSVHNMGETFGGYWASLPDFVLETREYPTGVYTIPSTEPETEPTTIDEHPGSNDDKNAEKIKKHKHNNDVNYISIDIPIVNISQRIEPGDVSDDLLDRLLNIDQEEEITGKDYYTAEIPLLNFSVWRAEDEKFLKGVDLPTTQFTTHRASVNVNTPEDLDDEDDDPIFKKDFDTSRGEVFREKQFLKDEIIPQKKPYNPQASRNDAVNDFASHGRDKKPIRPNKASFRLMKLSNPYMKFDHSYYSTEPSTDLRSTATKSEEQGPAPLDAKENLSSIKTLPLQFIKAKGHTDKVSENINKNNNVKDKKSEKMDYFDEVARPVQLLRNETTIARMTQKFKSETSAQPSSTKPLISMVNRESWENVVNVAPKLVENLNTTPKRNEDKHNKDVLLRIHNKTITDILKPHSIYTEGNVSNKEDISKHRDNNKTVKRDDDDRLKAESDAGLVKKPGEDYIAINDKNINVSNDGSKNHKNKLTRKVRKKRLLDSIPIRDAYPRPINTALVPASDSPSIIIENVANLEKIEQRVELQNDKLKNRISLRYGTQFLGEELFNLCNETDTQSKHVFLFNTSRIMVYIEGFELDMVTVVLTEAHVVSGNNCEDEYLECQLAGTRVCIDAMNACDGVPNCGADDIYDEDRLKCGYLMGIQHDVYLAAITFVILILTLLYVVHYWLKRCVPKVSSAFFIYTEGAEIKLNLSSVMRSPLTDDAEDLESIKRKSTTLVDYDQVFRQMSVIKNNIPCWERFKKLCSFYIRRPKHPDHLFEDDFKTRKTFSFTQLELQKLTQTDASVQMNESLELELLGNNYPTHQGDGTGYMSDESSEIAELNVLNFCRDAACKGCSIGTNTVLPMPALKQETTFGIRSFSEHDVDYDYGADQSYSEDSYVAFSQGSLSESLEPDEKIESRPRIGSLELAKARESRQRESVLPTKTRKGTFTRVESVDVHTETVPRPGGDKKLRFDEIAVTIDSKNTEEGTHRGKSVYGTKQLGVGQEKMDVIEEVSTATELKNFLLRKNKKGKKKQTGQKRP